MTRNKPKLQQGIAAELARSKAEVVHLQAEVARLRARQGPTIPQPARDDLFDEPDDSAQDRA